MKMTDDRRKVLTALAKGKKVTGRSADDYFIAVAYIGRTAIKPSVVDALYKSDLIDKNWEGLGNYTAVLTDAGRALLGGDNG